MNPTMEELVVYGDPTFTALRRKVEIPKPGSKEILIKVIAAGLNPKDWKHTEDRNESEALNAGDDIAGIVEAVGDDVFEYQAGDRVAAFHRITQPAGGWAEYAIAPLSTTFRLPPNVPVEAGAGIPLVLMTAAISLYQALQLPLPTATIDVGESVPLLIYGASTAVGAYALQLAKLSGSRIGPVIAVAGKGIDFVTSLNAAAYIVDYRDGNVADNILKAIEAVAPGKKLHHVLDATSDFGSHKVISDVLVASGGGQINMLDPAADMDKSWQWPEGVKFSLTFVASAYGRKHPWISEERALQDKEFAYWFYRYVTHLLAEGKLEPHPYEVLPNGLDGVLQGIKDLKSNKISAKKLIIRIADTPGL